MTAWVPFTFIFFGISPVAAISLIFVAALFPILVNTTAGAHSVSVALLRAGKMLGASETYLLRRVVLPSALPNIFTGLRLGIGMAWVAVIVAEMIGVKSGLGYILWQAYYWNRMDMLICTVLTIGVLGFLSDRMWHVATRAWLPPMAKRRPRSKRQSLLPSQPQGDGSEDRGRLPIFSVTG